MSWILKLGHIWNWHLSWLGDPDGLSGNVISSYYFFGSHDGFSYLLPHFLATNLRLLALGTHSYFIQNCSCSMVSALEIEPWRYHKLNACSNIDLSLYALSLHWTLDLLLTQRLWTYVVNYDCRQMHWGHLGSIIEKLSKPEVLWSILSTVC